MLTLHQRAARPAPLRGMNCLHGGILAELGGPSMTLLSNRVGNNLACVRLFDSRVNIRRAVAGARITGTTLTAKLFAPGPVRMVLADKADAEADGTVGIGHGMKKRAGPAP